MKLDPSFLALIKRNRKKEFAGKSDAEFLAADPFIISGVTMPILERLEKYGITSIESLSRAEGFFRIDPDWFQRLNCVLRKLPEYDPGPPCEWEWRFNSAPIAQYEAYASRFRLEFGPVFYRGRLNGSAKILVVGQDPSTDEILAQRAFVGFSGQRVQKYLLKLGITQSYIMLNTFLFGIHGQFDNEMRDIAVVPDILNFRNQLLDKVKADNNLEAIISFGNGADHAVRNWPNRTGIPWFELTHPAASNQYIVNNWNSRLFPLHTEVTPDDPNLVDLTPYPANMVDAEVNIPRKDLPFGIPRWHGTSGATRSSRQGSNIISWAAP